MGVKYIRKITEDDEVPNFNEEGLRKFFLYSYDPELGWVRKPFTSDFENGKDGRVVMFRIDDKGARYNPGHQDLRLHISIYGDSFAMSRQVNDNETIAYYLSELTNSNVLNFGVGNYGADQAFLRIKREYPKNKTEKVVLAIVPEQILRITSYWKHYLEYGNHFGFKPRFELSNNGLRLIPNIMDSEEKFDHLRELIPKIKKHDYWYERKFSKDFGKEFTWDEMTKVSLDLRVKYFSDKESVKIFSGIIDLFKKYSQEQKFIPFLVFLPYKNDVSFTRENCSSFYSNFVSICSKKIDTLDLMSHLVGLDDKILNKYYSDDNDYGGHYSKEGNMYISNIIYNFLK